MVQNRPGPLRPEDADDLRFYAHFWYAIEFYQTLLAAAFANASTADLPPTCIW